MTFQNNAIYLPPLMQQLWDKTLNVPLSGGFVNFFEDENRTIPKDVYELTGTGPGSYSYVNIGSELTLSGIGTYVDENGGNLQVFLWPYLGTPNDNPPSTIAQPYYITVYSSTGVFQFDVPNWPPGIGSNNTPINTADTTDNVLANDQFVEVLFPTTATVSSPWQLSVSGTMTATPIAPDWSLVTTGSGTISLYQITNSDDTAPGNPANALAISTSGFSQPIILRQRINNPRLFTGQFPQYVSGTFIVASTSGSASTVTMNYTSSIGGVIQPICSGTTLLSGYTRIFNNPAILLSDPGSGTGTVDITLVFPANQGFIFSCIQLCGVTSQDEIVAYLQQTPARIDDHLFHYWNNPLQFKPTPSFLVGWDFALNPFQFSTVPGTITTTPSYIADQTISATSSSTALFTVATDTNSLVIHTNASNQGIYILQYLSGDQAFAITQSYVSSMVTAYLGASTGSVNVYLFYSNGAGTIPSLPTTIGTVNAAGQFTLTASGWTQVSQLTPTGPSKLSTTNTDADRAFNGFNTRNLFGSSATANFAIVVTFSITTTGDDINILSVGLNKGLIATRPSPQTADQVLRECQNLYEMSYNLGTSAGTATTVGECYAINPVVQSGGHSLLYLNSFQVEFKTVKRTTPNLKFYSPDGTSATGTGTVSVGVYRSGTSLTTNNYTVNSNYTFVGFSSTNRFLIKSTNTNPVAIDVNPGQAGDEGLILYHYTADARFGIV